MDQLDQLKHQRIEFIDIAKGLGIILVVWYHIGYCPGAFLNLFFMPLFFLISGIFFKAECDQITFYRKRSKQLFGPLIIGITLGIIVEIFINKLESFHATLESGFYNFWLVGNVPLWFLVALFWTMFITYNIEHYCKSSYIKIPLYLFFSFLGYAIFILWLRNTLFIGQSLLIFPFFVIGYKLKDFWMKKKWHSWITFIICAILAVLFYYYNINYTNIHRLRIHPYYFPSFFAAIALILFVFEISVFLEGTKLGKLLSKVGEYTIFVLILHDLFVPSVQKIFEILPTEEFNILSQFLSIAFAVILCYITIALGKIIKQLLPTFFP